MLLAVLVMVTMQLPPANAHEDKQAGSAQEHTGLQIIDSPTSRLNLQLPVQILWAKPDIGDGAAGVAPHLGGAAAPAVGVGVVECA